MAVLCPGNGGLEPCRYQAPVRFVVKINSVRGWRGRFCNDCVAEWLKGIAAIMEKGDKITIETLW